MEGSCGMSFSQASTYAVPSAVQVPLQFTGEEMYGRYLDLHEFFLDYINMTSKKQPAQQSQEALAGELQMDYITYVQQFTHFHRIPRHTKFQKAYVQYVEKLLRYLISFHERTQPLKSVVTLLGQVEDEFEEKWEQGEFLGWQDRVQGEVPSDVDLVTDVDAFDSPEDLLQELGMATNVVTTMANTFAHAGGVTRCYLVPWSIMYILIVMG